MSIEDFEAAISKQKDVEATAERQRDQKLAKQTKDSAASAATFLAMMKKYGIEPEPIYSHFQDRRKRGPVEVFKKVDEGWVVKYSLDDAGLPWLMSYLSRDGKIGTCEIRNPLVPDGFKGHHKVEGLGKRAKRQLFGNRSVLCLKVMNGKPDHKKRRPYFDQATFVKAARQYTELYN